MSGDCVDRPGHSGPLPPSALEVVSGFSTCPLWTCTLPAGSPAICPRSLVSNAGAAASGCPADGAAVLTVAAAGGTRGRSHALRTVASRLGGVPLQSDGGAAPTLLAGTAPGTDVMAVPARLCGCAAPATLASTCGSEASLCTLARARGCAPVEQRLPPRPSSVPVVAVLCCDTSALVCWFAGSRERRAKPPGTATVLALAALSGVMLSRKACVLSAPWMLAPDHSALTALMSATKRHNTA